MPSWKHHELVGYEGVTNQCKNHFKVVRPGTRNTGTDTWYIVRFESGYEVEVGHTAIIRGKITDHTRRLVFGHRISALPEFIKEHKGLYQRYTAMLNRVYTHPSYKDVTVCERWFDFANFYADLKDLPRYKEWAKGGSGLCLDKDTIKPGNRVYGPGLVCIVDRSANSRAVKTAKEVEYIPTGAVYRSTREAAKATGVGKSTVSNHCIGGVSAPKFRYKVSCPSI